METTEKAKVLNLPIFQHFDSNSLVTQGKGALDRFRKGEKGIFQGTQLVTLCAVGGLGYLTWVYVLPPVFYAIGAALATVGVGALLTTCYFLAPVAIKGLRRHTRSIHKMVIKYDPFGELEEQRQKMLYNLGVSKQAKAQIKILKGDMENEANLSEKKANQLQKDIILNKGKADKLKAEIEEMKKQGGQAATGSDEYVEKNAEYMTVLAEATRQGHMLEQSQNYVRKYGSRALVMQKVDQKLVIAITFAEIKIKDFEVTIESLTNDSKFISKTRQATEAAKSAIGFTTGWELDYALDVVNSTIAEDTAATTVNLNDISSLTANFDLNSDDMYAKLDLLANDIKVGTNITPDSKQYRSPDYKLTSEDKAQSGGFGNMFN